METEPKKKKSFQSKSKGNKFQRLISKKLSLWISGGEHQDILWSSTSSGGQRTIHAKKNNDAYKSQAGDLQAIKQEGKWLIDKFYLELKSYKDLGLDNFFIGGPSLLAKFWDTTTNLAFKEQRIPAMLIKLNSKPEFMLLPAGLLPDPYVKNLHRGCDVFLLDQILSMPYASFVDQINEII